MVSRYKNANTGSFYELLERKVASSTKNWKKLDDG
jgi:hypothetical protein